MKGDDPNDSTVTLDDPSPADGAAYASATERSGAQLRPETRIGRYIVEACIGRGGMGLIYAAYDPELGRRVALKVMRAAWLARCGGEEARWRLLREAQALARLAHPNVVTVHDVGLVDEGLFIAMELVEGEDLKRWLAARPRGWQRIVEVFRQAGAGLIAAHRVGLLHRDFKPANVMLGSDGRVKVLDFGLARRAAEAPDSGPATSISSSGEDFLALSLTRDGGRWGTLAYMAPERHGRGEADARSDQFSFCVALYEALYGQLPFPGDDGPALLAAMRNGRLRQPPAGSRVPRWLWRLLRRGLASEPAARHSSMEALLSRLDHRPRARRRAAAASVLLLAVGLALVSYLQSPSARLCRGAERHLMEVWDADRKATIRAAFAASKKVYAAGLWRGTEAALDRYAARWVAMRTEACEATHLRGEQSAQLLDLRMACLDRRLAAFAALSNLLVEADDQIIERAVQAAGGLGSLSLCADGRALLAVVAPPQDADLRQQVETLRQDVAATRALLDLGKNGRAIAAAQGLAARLEGVDYAPAVAEALHVIGLTEQAADDYAAAAGTLSRAAALADRGHHDESRFASLIALVWVTGYQQGDRQAAARWLQLARGNLDRLGAHPQLAVLWHQADAMLQLQGGDYAAALTAAATAAADSRRHNGADHRHTLRSLSTLGNAQYLLGRYEDALSTFAEVEAIRRRTLGAAHPEVAYAQQARGELLKNLGRYEEALEPLTRALDTLETALGPAHSRVAVVLESLGNVHARLGHGREALQALHRVLALRRQLAGEESTAVAAAHTNIGVALWGEERLDEAEIHLRRAVAIHLGTDGAAHPETLAVRVNLGGLLRDQGRPEEALDDLRAAHQEAVRQLGVAHATSIYAGLTLGMVLLDLERPGEGLPAIRGAVASLDPEHAADWLLGLARFAQARAARAAGQHAAARRLGEEARDIFRRMGAAGALGRAQVEGWLAVGL